ncbi:MAG: M48 family metallopeptidase [bacterium]
MVNGYFMAALSGLVVVEAIHLAAELLNLRALSLELPQEFADVYDAETYRGSQTYTRVKTRFGLSASLFDLVVLLVFWLAGGFGWLDGLVRGWGLSPIWTGLVFLLILVVGRAILSLPFSIWGVFVIEERFGFNRTSARTFVLDLVRGLGISVVLGVPLAVGFLALFEYAGGLAWIYAWAAVVAFSFVMQILAPRLIMPLFNKFTPLEDGDLKDAIMAYAQKAGFPLKDVFSIDASRRSTKGNAFFTGFGNSRRIALFDTLIQRHSTEELVAVLAHEVGHYKKRHVLIGTVTSALETGLFVGLFALLVQQTGLFVAFSVASPSYYAGVLFVAVLLRPLQFVLSVGAAALSRHHERQADVFAATTTGRGDLLAGGLRRLSKDNLSNLTPHPFYVFLNYSHPPVLQRVRSLDSNASG